MEILWQTLAFVAKGAVVFAILAALAILIASLIRRGRGRGDEGGIRIRRIDERLWRQTDGVRRAVMDPKAYKKDRRVRAAARKKRGFPEKNVYLLTFRGDIAASAVESLRQEVTALLAVAGKEDEVIVRLESGGGLVNAYGLAASQLVRLRDKGVRLVICVDKVAASGGYMMACVADRILAAPFAILGSIGVVAQVPNLHRWLERHGVDYDEMTAGEYKRTVSLLAEISDKGREKFQEQIEDAHSLFKDFIAAQRPAIDLPKAATGEYWYGTRAVELGLVDELTTSDDYVLSKVDDAAIFEVRFERPRRLRERAVSSVAEAMERALLNVWTRLDASRYA